MLVVDHRYTFEWKHFIVNAAIEKNWLKLGLDRFQVVIGSMIDDEAPLSTYTYYVTPADVDKFGTFGEYARSWFDWE